LASEAGIHWAILSPAADALGDRELKKAGALLESQTNRQLSLLQDWIRQDNPQTLLAGIP
jgi:hypothetical protein